MSLRPVAVGAALLAATFLALMVVVAVRRAKEPAVRLNEDHPGYVLYTKLECFRCHGPRLRGSPKAPPLLDLAEHWDIERLARYLQDPDSTIAHNPRLLEQARSYRYTPMPEYDLDPELLRTVADFVLQTRSRKGAGSNPAVE